MPAAAGMLSLLERLELLACRLHGWAMLNLLDDPALLALLFC